MGSELLPCPLCSDSLLAGLSRDSDDCVSHLCTPPLLAITSWAAKERSQYSPPPGEPGRHLEAWEGLTITSGFHLSLKETFVPLGPSSDKALDCMTHWSRVLEPEIVNTASEQAGKSGAWEKEWDSEPQPHEGTPCSISDVNKDHYHDQDLVKRNHCVAKVSQGYPHLGYPH